MPPARQEVGGRMIKWKFYSWAFAWLYLTTIGLVQLYSSIAGKDSIILYSAFFNLAVSAAWFYFWVKKNGVWIGAKDD